MNANDKRIKQIFFYYGLRLTLSNEHYYNTLINPADSLKNVLVESSVQKKNSQ